MKEMKYHSAIEVFEKRFTTELLDNGTYDGYEYYIVSRGTHPCAYIKIPKGDELYGKGYDDLTMEFDVHGGFTYSDDHLSYSDDTDAWFIGWDYAHYGDYSGFNILSDGEDCNDPSDVKYSTQEIFLDVKKVINQIK